MIQFTADGKTYTLEFDRASVLRAEKELGLTMDSLSGRGVSSAFVMETLFHAAMLKHHPAATAGQAAALYRSMTNKQGLLEALANEYTRPIEEMFAEPEEGKATMWLAV